jgi:hypothetical protein
MAQFFKNLMRTSGEYHDSWGKITGLVAKEEGNEAVTGPGWHLVHVIKLEQPWISKQTGRQSEKLRTRR